MSATQESVQEILSNKEPAAVAAAPETTGDTKAAPPAAGTTTDDKPDGDKAAQTRDASGKFQKAPEADASKPDANQPDKPRADVAAIIDERRKRQAAEARVRELEGNAGKDAAKPSVLEDEDKAFSTRIDEGTRGIREQLYHLSMDNARLRHGDAFAEAEEAFANAAEKDERLIEGLRNSANPGEYVFSMGFHVKELADVGGNLQKYREKITADSRTQIAERDTRIKALEAQVAELTHQKTELETLPRSLNSRTSAAPAAGSVEPEDIKSIARFGNQSH